MKDVMLKTKFSGKKLKIKIIDSGQNQNRIAQILGIHPNHLSMWVRGIKKPSIDNLSKLAKGLNCPMEEFFE